MGWLIKNIFAFAALFFCCDFPPPPHGGLRVVSRLCARVHVVGGGNKELGAHVFATLRKKYINRKMARFQTINTSAIY